MHAGGDVEHGGHDDLGQILPLVANWAVLEAFRRVGTSVEVTALVKRARVTARAVAVPCRGDCCRPHAYP